MCVCVLIMCVLRVDMCVHPCLWGGGKRGEQRLILKGQLFALTVCYALLLADNHCVQVCVGTGVDKQGS